MSAFDDHKEEIQHYEQMLGAHRGRLAVTLDRLLRFADERFGSSR